jgi:hypothetical protein
MNRAEGPQSEALFNTVCRCQSSSKTMTMNIYLCRKSLKERATCPRHKSHPPVLGRPLGRDKMVTPAVLHELYGTPSVTYYEDDISPVLLLLSQCSLVHGLDGQSLPPLPPDPIAGFAYLSDLE